MNIANNVVAWDISTSHDSTVITFGYMSDGKLFIANVHYNPSPSKLARLWRRDKANRTRIAKRSVGK